VQAQELLHDAQQEEDPGSAGDEEILPFLSEASTSQGIEVALSEWLERMTVDPTMSRKAIRGQ
jgi:hypothetical protein